MGDSNLQKALHELQKAHKASEEKIKKVSQYLGQTEQILLNSDSICSLPIELDNFVDSVKMIQEKYDFLGNIDKSDEALLTLREQEAHNLYEDVVKKLSRSN